MLSSGTNVIICDKMLSSGANVIMVSSGANVIIWCYHVMLSSGMITHPFLFFLKTSLTPRTPLPHWFSPHPYWAPAPLLTYAAPIYAAPAHLLSYVATLMSYATPSFKSSASLVFHVIWFTVLCICEGTEETWNERATRWLKRAQKVNVVFLTHSVFHVFFVNQLKEWSCQALFTWKTKQFGTKLMLFSWIHLCSKRFLLEECRATFWICLGIPFVRVQTGTQRIRLKKS